MKRMVSIGMALLLAATAQAAGLKFKNADFYDKDGQFNVEKAKDAVIKLMKHHGCPVFAGLREKLWVSDYGKGQFAKLGLAAVVHVNNEKDRYMMLDMYLLPGQMLPEHWHLATDKNPVKLEGWLVRYGWAHIVGEGEPNLGPDVVVPACHDGGKVTVKHETVCKPGQMACLNRAEAHHWQLAGPEGAIITEVANVHDGAGVRHQDKVCNDYFLKAK